MHQSRHNGRAVANDAVGIELHQLLRKSLHARRIAFGIAVLDAKVLADGPALRFETLLESHQAGSGFRIVGKPHQHPHGAYASCQLRICRDRPARDCAADQSNELAAVHSITRSSPTGRTFGITMPRAFAVPRLITSSNFVGTRTGRSAGSAPRRMRLTYSDARRNGSMACTPYDTRPPASAKYR